MLAICTPCAVSCALLQIPIYAHKVDLRTIENDRPIDNDFIRAALLYCGIHTAAAAAAVPGDVNSDGIVSGEEDSAILIEALFDTPWHFGSVANSLGYKYKNTKEMIAAFPHLQGKLDLLAAAAKKLWGYAYWEQMSLY